MEKNFIRKHKKNLQISSIKYTFETKLKAKPKRNEDGSINFHKLDIMNPVHEGDILETLTSETPSELGLNVYGNMTRPSKIVSFGKNIIQNRNFKKIKRIFNQKLNLSKYNYKNKNFKKSELISLKFKLFFINNSIKTNKMKLKILKIKLKIFY